jgi:HAMP domain-containing protein
MSLKLKFNLVFVLLFGIALAVAGGSVYRLVYANANAEVVHDAQRMMDIALAVRDYTSVQIKPHLDPLLEKEFLPQTVPAFAATETLKRMADRQPGYSYKEATLNPTNLRDQATPWERDIVESFRAQPTLTELQGNVRTVDGEKFYVARPIQIKSPKCLSCHSTPEVAPASMLAKYGKNAGFGWQLNEIVGAQVVAVPTELPKSKAQQVFLTFMGALIIVFISLFAALNWLLQRLVIKPVREVADAAQRVSKGDMSLAEFAESRRDEIGTLQRSFNRMRRSVVKAMGMLSRS